MAYTAPTVDDIKRKFPAFLGVADDVVSIFLDEAIDHVGPLWIDKDRKNAQMYYCAHLLSAQGFANSTVVIDSSGSIVAEESTPIIGQRIVMHKVGDTTVQFEATSAGQMASNASGSPGGSNGQLDLSQTIYGQVFLRLQRLNHPAIGVV